MKHKNQSPNPWEKGYSRKWVFKVKYKSNGNLERYKARLVAKGYNQKFIDYKETFSPVVKISTIRCLIAVGANKKQPLGKLDVNSAFLHGDLNEQVYMQPVLQYIKGREKVCKLRKSIYGLNQFKAMVCQVN